MSLCLNDRTAAPLSRVPNLIDEWLSSSEMTRQPLPTRAGMLVELVANPIDVMSASSLPTNLATSSSAWTWRSSVPASRRAPAAETPYRRMDSSTASAHPPVAAANPR